MLNAVSHRSIESIFCRFRCGIDTGIVKPGPPDDSNEIRRWSSWPSTFSGRRQLKSMYSQFFIEPMIFSGRWLESGLADEEMALTGVGSCGSFGGAGMDGADKRGRAS